MAIEKGSRPAIDEEGATRLFECLAAHVSQLSVAEAMALGLAIQNGDSYTTLSQRARRALAAAAEELDV